jgi:hypothetical protein
MSKHTAAPWIIDGENNLIHSSDDRHTIVCSIGNIKHPAVMADARLIAAAPTMLEALAQINYWVCYVTEEDIEARLMAMQQIGVHARAAIAKATS